MKTLEKIEKKKEEFTKVRRQHEAEIKELQWEYIKAKHNLTKNCICDINGAHYLLIDIKNFFSERNHTIELTLQKIYFDGTVNNTKKYFKLREVKKVYDNLEDYITSLGPIERIE